MLINYIANLKHFRERLILFLTVVSLILGTANLHAWIPVNNAYFRIYDFMDEMATEGHIDLNSVCRPYSHEFILQQLSQINPKDLNFRQRKDLLFYLKNVQISGNSLSGKNVEGIKYYYNPPSIVYRDSFFKTEMAPMLGMYITTNDAGSAIRRWYGAEFKSALGKNFAFWGSLRDISHQGILVSQPTYLNQEPGFEYTVGTDFSDSRGGISYSNKWVDLAFQRDNLIWGDNYHGSNILSGRTPSYPMIYLKLHPSRWFEFNYFHAWLVSNVVDSTRYYLENGITKHYRPASKFMAANMITFRPWKHTGLSIGNSIVYGESSPVAGFFVPLSMFKSIDHSMTKGIATENQNSQLFLNVSSRYIKHLHVYGSLFFDEIQFGRFLPSSSEKNPASIKAGFRLINIPIDNLSLTGEFTRTNIINYKHSISVLDYSSNSYNLGNYLGDNSEEFFLSLAYKPIRGLDLNLSWNSARHGNEYIYFRRGYIDGVYGKIDHIIAYPSLGDIIWEKSELNFTANYELMKNTYALIRIEKTSINAFEPEIEKRFGEVRMTASETLDRFTSTMYQGDHFTFSCGLSFGF